MVLWLPQKGEIINENTIKAYQDYYELMKIFHPIKWKAFVYFISNGIHVKIGRTKDVLKRFTQLQVGSSDDLELLGIIPFESVEESIEIEKELHNLYKDYCVRGEWYDIEDLTEIVFDIDEWDGNCKKELWDKWEKRVFPNCDSGEKVLIRMIMGR